MNRPIFGETSPFGNSRHGGTITNQPEWVSNLREVNGLHVAQLPGVKDGYFTPLSSLMWFIKEYADNTSEVSAALA